MSIQTITDPDYTEKTWTHDADCIQRMRTELNAFLSHHIDDPAVGWPGLHRRLRRDHTPGGPASGAVAPITAVPIRNRPAREIMIVSDRPEPIKRSLSKLDQPLPDGRGSDRDAPRTRFHGTNRKRRPAGLRTPMDIVPFGADAPLRPLSHSPISITAPPERSALPDSRGADPPGGFAIATAEGDEFPQPGGWWARFLNALRGLLLRYAANLIALYGRIKRSARPRDVDPKHADKKSCGLQSARPHAYA